MNDQSRAARGDRAIETIRRHVVLMGMAQAVSAPQLTLKIQSQLDARHCQ